METTHEFYCGSATNASEVPAGAVDLVVTSPPYPMIQMWDEQFATQSPAVDEALETDDAWSAFEAMHQVLDDVWDDVARVIGDSGIVCINIGDATRSMDGEFHRFPNHERITTAFVERGFTPLPSILWNKQTNAPNKFMGSGMKPPNAYVTLEHEHLLIFRKGGTRSSFPTNRGNSAYFWTERNRWFSDLWEDVHGTEQSLNAATRTVSAAYPREIPYRLITMYSVYQDTVYDPFAGTGTTTEAAIATGRNSIAYELEADVLDEFDVEAALDYGTERLRTRVHQHQQQVEQTDKDTHQATHHNLQLIGRGTDDVQLYTPTGYSYTGSKLTVRYELFNRDE